MEIKKTADDSDEVISKSNIITANVVILVVFLLIVGGVIYMVSKKTKGSQVFPAGINYLSPTNVEEAKPVLLYDFAKLAESTDWLTYKGKIFSYSLQYPKTLTPLTFPNDKMDAVTFKVNQMPPEQSLLLSIETISSRDKTLVGKPEEFIRSYWKYFSGLKGLNKIEPVTNEKGLKGFKATYIIKANNSITGDSYFYMIEGNDDNLIRVADVFPVEGRAVFNRINNSLEYTK